MKTVGIPTVKGMGGAFKGFGWGAVGGLIFLIAYKLFGPLGIIAAPLIAGSMMKGERGEQIATMSGFLLLALGVLGMQGGGNATSNTSQEVM